MPKNVLILTSPGDAHAYAVAEALRRRKAKVTIWHTPDFPTRSHETIEFSSSGLRLLLSDLADPDTSFQVVWHRRPAFSLDTSSLHPSDVPFVREQCRIFRDGLFRLLCPSAFWINPRASARQARNKIIQQKLAQDVGFLTPDTVYSNDSQEIQSFIENRERPVVFKPLMGMQWHKGEEIAWVPFTSQVSAEDLVDGRVIQSSPGIFQEMVAKKYELRVTMMGAHAYAARIWSQETEKGRIDWRKAYDEIAIERVTLEKEIYVSCVELLKTMGLVFGCIDLIVTPGGDIYFLEINQMGQFLFLEEPTGLPLLDAFVQFVLAGQFDWTQADATAIRYTDVQEEVVSSLENSYKMHVPASANVIHEDGSST